MRTKKFTFDGTKASRENKVRLVKKLCEALSAACDADDIESVLEIARIIGGISNGIAAESDKSSEEEE